MSFLLKCTGIPKTVDFPFYFEYFYFGHTFCKVFNQELLHVIRVFLDRGSDSLTLSTTGPNVYELVLLMLQNMHKFMPYNPKFILIPEGNNDNLRLNQMFHVLQCKTSQSFQFVEDRKLLLWF